MKLTFAKIPDPNATMVLIDTGGDQCARCGRFRSDGFKTPDKVVRFFPTVKTVKGISFCKDWQECLDAKEERDAKAAERAARQALEKKPFPGGTRP